MRGPGIIHFNKRCKHLYIVTATKLNCGENFPHFFLGQVGNSLIFYKKFLSILCCCIFSEICGRVKHVKHPVLLLLRRIKLSSHRRRMSTEEKTKVIASVWGAKYIKFFAAILRSYFEE